MTKKPYSDSRWWDEPKPIDLPCNNCKHYLGVGKCKAFEKIPREVLVWDVPHDKPYPGDNGFMYEPNEETNK